MTVLNEADKLYLGNEIVDSVYADEEKVWPGFSPIDIDGLEIWLDASQLELEDGEEINTWPNLGNPALVGTNLNVSGYRPKLRANALNSLSVSRFFINSGLRWAGTGIDLNWTIVYVGRIWGVPSGVGRIISSSYPTSNLLIGYWNFYEDVAFVEGFLTPDARKAQTNNWRLYTASGEGVPGDAKAWLYQNGEFLSGNHQVVGGWKGFLNLNGYSSLGIEETCECEVAEVLMYDRKLSDVERQQVENYLREKWGLV